MKIRKIKVCGATCVSTKNTPCIRLQGHWLEEIGYKVGDEVIVAVLSGWLLIRPAEECETEDFNR